MNNMRNKILMTLALLLTAVTGAWAADTYNVTFKANGNTTTVENVTLPKTFKCDISNADGELDLIIKQLYGLSGSCCSPNAPTSSGSENVTCGSDDANQFITISAPFEGTATVTGKYHDETYEEFGYSLEITCTQAVDNTIDVTPVAGKTNEWTFTMPAFDVEIAPIYAPVAQWAKVEDVDQLPKAIEGVIADTDAPLIVEGTVAFAGQSTTVKQGTVMYAVTPATVTEAPALDAANKWSADVPTAKLVADAGDVKVWYYIKGADTPEGKPATAENTFNDSEICATPITVTLLSNKFDINFKAANDNTIEAGKATVKVGDEAAEVKEGKLTGVKMNSKVTVTAKEGYKFRKVEVKKGIAPPDPVTVTWNSPNFKGSTYTKDGVTLTGNASGNNFYDGGDKTFTNTIGKFTKIEIVCEGNNFDGWAKESAGGYQIPEGPYVEVFRLTWTGNAESVTIPGGNYLYGISSITFTIQ